MLTYHLCPLMTISLPSWRIEVLMLVASEDATVEHLVGSEPGRMEVRTKSFRHSKGGADFTVQQRNEPFLLLFRRSVSSQDLFAESTGAMGEGMDRTHISGIGCRAVQGFWSELPAPTQNLCNQGILGPVNRALTMRNSKSPRD